MSFPSNILAGYFHIEFVFFVACLVLGRFSLRGFFLMFVSSFSGPLNSYDPVSCAETSLCFSEVSVSSLYGFQTSSRLCKTSRCFPPNFRLIFSNALMFERRAAVL